MAMAQNMNLELKVAQLDNYTLKKEIKQALVERQVASMQGVEAKIAYWDTYFAVLAGEAGARGVALVQQSKPKNGYKLNAEAIKNKVDIVEYIGRYTRLCKAGIDKYSGLCPLHSERFPSLFVYSERQDWYCFGCLRGGDIFNFVMVLNDCDFKQSLTILGGEL